MEKAPSLVIDSTFIDEVRFMLEQLDIPVKQVMIEARLVIARSDAAEELGVRWGLQRISLTTDNTRLKSNLVLKFPIRKRLPVVLPPLHLKKRYCPWR